MAAEAFIVTELTGPQREVRLFGRALPYQHMKAPYAQRYVQHWYPGSRVATIQVLGPEFGDWTGEGMWKTRYLAAERSVELVGFSDIENTGGRITAEELREVFRRICLAGQTVEVRWGPEIRRGILADFTPDYDRVEDIAWTWRFVWSQDGEREASRASISLDTTSAMRRSLDALDLAAAEAPSTILPRQLAELRAKVAEVRAAGAAYTEVLARVQAETTTAIADVQNVQALAERVVQAGDALRTGSLSDLPYYELLPVDDVATTLAVEVWRRDTAAATRDVQATARQSSAGVSTRLTPGALKVVTVKQDTTLRLLAQQELGSADSWPLIADANGFTGSLVTEGTRVMIPRPAGQGVVSR